MKRDGRSLCCRCQSGLVCTGKVDAMMKKQLMDVVRSLFDDGVLRPECVTCQAPARRIGRGLDFECSVHGRIHWATNEVRAFAIDDADLARDLVCCVKKSKRA